MAYAQINGIQIYYEEHGEGPALLLITGFAAEGNQWQHQIRTLQQHYRVICLDNRGIGKSDAPTGPYNTELLAHDCAALLKHLHIDKAHVCGYSLGGRIAQMLAIHHPTLVDKLILASTSMRSYALSRFILKMIIDMLRQGLPHQCRIKATLPWFYSPAFFEDERKVAYFCHFLGRQAAPNVDALQAQLDAVNSHAPGERLRTIKHPTLITSSAEDLLCPKDYTDELHTFIPHATRCIMPHGGHACIHEYPDVFNALILAFLTEDHPS